MGLSHMNHFRMKNNNSHFILYAKGWYKITDTMSDLKVIMGEYCGIEPEYITDWDVTERLLKLIHELGLMKTKEHFIDFIYRHQIRGESIVDICLSVIRCIQVKNADTELIEIDEPDETVLPLKNPKKD